MCLPDRVEGVTIQKIAATVGNLLVFNFGLIFGITPSHAKLYQDVATPLNRSVDREATVWISAYLFLGAAFGALVFGLLTRKIGYKSVLLLSGLLQIVSWSCIHFAYDIVHIHSSRIFAGVAIGGAYTALPFFIADITEDSNRSALLASIDQWRTLGILIGLVMGSFLQYTFVILIGIGVSFAFNLSCPFVQESPYYFLHKGNEDLMEKSFRWYRGIRHLDDREKPEFLRELGELKAKMKSDKQIATNDIPRTYVLKLFLYILVLEGGAQLMAAYVFLNYGDAFFPTSSSGAAQFIYEYGVLILAVIQFFGAFFSSFIIEKTGRKRLLTVTALLCGLSLFMLALCVHNSRQWQITPTHIAWLNLALLSVHMFFCSFGVQPLAVIVTYEMVPSKLHTYVNSFVIPLSWLLQFALIQSFDIIKTASVLTVYYWFIAGVSVTVAIVALLLLPETRGRSMQEVQHQMGYLTNEDVAKLTTITDGRITIGHM